MLRGIVVRHLVGRARPIVTAMAEELAVRCTTDTETREALVRAYEASYSTTSQLSTIGAENRLSSHCAAWVRPIRDAHGFPDVPISVLMAGDKPLSERSRSLNETVAPGAEHLFVAESGHYIHRDDPEAVLTALDGVLGDGRGR
jgi:hypothetical protein